MSASPREGRVLSPRKRLEVIVYQANGIRNMQYITAYLGNMQDPYVIAKLMPAGEIKQQTEPHIGGGTEPVWEGYADSQMQLALPRGEAAVSVEAVQIEIWNSNVVLDELIGKVLVSVDDIKANNGKKISHKVDTGGEIVLAIHHPLSQEDIEARHTKLAEAGKGDLLHGDFNEKKCRADFQNAVSQWRTDGSPISKGSEEAETVQEQQTETETDNQLPESESPAPELAVQTTGEAEPPAPPTETDDE